MIYTNRHLTLQETEEETKARMKAELKRELEKYERDRKLGLVDERGYRYVRAHWRFGL